MPVGAAHAREALVANHAGGEADQDRCGLAQEIYEDLVPLSQTRRFELRPGWSANQDYALRYDGLTLFVTYLKRRRHLPIIELKRAA